MRFRQVHLDFHTSGEVPGVGSAFSKENFQAMLKLGHVDSITVFSKCHHGWAYHPSKANTMHPTLKFDLLKAQIEAAHEIGVKTPVYLSAGYDEKLARQQPGWLVAPPSNDGQVANFLSAGWHLFCMNSPYLDILLDQIEEVMRNYDADGIFLDIVGVKPCCCARCVDDIIARGKDPRDPEAILEQAEIVYKNYYTRVRERMDTIDPKMHVFHNAGNIFHGRRDLTESSTHIEVESLPTGGWGYDNLPLSARYIQPIYGDYLGMTGKFHSSWGEFGGFKHPNAMRYEVALNLAHGAKTSVGDQLHPDGKMDETTYSIIGVGFADIEAKEPWCDNVVNVADIGILSGDAFPKHAEDTVGERGGKSMSNAGVLRLLNEGGYLYDFLDAQSALDGYKVIVLSDAIILDAAMQEKINAYLAKGGKILACGMAGLNAEKTKFDIDLGVRYIGPNAFHPSYIEPYFEMQQYPSTAFVLYGKGQDVEVTDATVLANQQDSYFNRDVFRFCSHKHTPNDKQTKKPGMTENKNGIYIAWNIFDDYAHNGSFILKEVFNCAMDRLLGERKTLLTNLPSAAIRTVQHQAGENRFVNHLLYVQPMKRGSGTEVIEDIVPMYDTKVTLRTDKKIKRVYLAPQNEEIPFVQEGNSVCYTVKKFECHQMVVLDY